MNNSSCLSISYYKLHFSGALLLISGHSSSQCYLCHVFLAFSINRYKTKYLDVNV